MARTFHQKPFTAFRHMRVQNRKKCEAAIIDRLFTEDESVPVRHINRIINYLSLIPEPWHDFDISAWHEYHNKHNKVTRCNARHFTKNEVMV